MNCSCNQPAVVRVVQKAGDNFGKKFFSCPGNKCNFFCWVGGLPTSVRSYVNRNSPIKGSSSAFIKLFLHEIESWPSRKVWFSSINSFDPSLVNFFLSFPDRQRKFVDSSKIWVFDFEIYDQFSNFIRDKFSGKFEVSELPKFLSVGLKKYLNNLPSETINDDQYNLQPKMLDTLLPFQVDGIRFVIHHGGRAMIADEMGCGKTIQAIAAMQHYRDHWPVLILVPPNLITQWHSELLTYCNDLLSEKDICIIRKSSDSVKGKVCIIPYSLLDKLTEKDKLRYLFSNIFF